MTESILPAELLFSTSFPVRLFVDDNDNPWFCHKDICNVLGYKNSSKVLKDHCKSKGVTKRYPLTKGGKQGVNYINEGNLYRLIVKSKKPQAEEFEEWVFEEVLPQIRKTGSYSMDVQTISAREHQLIKEAVANCTRFMKHESQSLAHTIYRNMKKHFGYDKIEKMPAAQFKEAITWIGSHQTICHQYYMTASRVEQMFIKKLKKQDFEGAAEVNVDILSLYNGTELLETWH